MLRAQLASLCVFLFCAFVVADNPYPVNVSSIAPWASGEIGNGTIYYQTKDFYFFGNVLNPITVSISYSTGFNFPASFCLNSFAQSLPIAGTNLESNCPSGAYGVVSNNIMTNGQPINDEDTPDGTVDDTVTANIFVKPASDIGFVVTLPDAEDKQNFTISWEAKQCTDLTLFPVGSNNQCIPIANMTSSQIVTVGAGTFSYLRVIVPPYSQTTNNISISVNGTTGGILMFTQQEYLPTQEWYMETDNDVDGDITTATILTPGYYNTPEVFYVGLFNSNDGTRKVSVNMTYNGCSSPVLFGYNCQHNSTNTTANGGIRPFPATLTKSENYSLTVNNGSAISYDFSDDSYNHDYAYFVLTDYPSLAFPYSVKVSVGNNDVSDLSGAPGIFAKLGSYPSAQSHHYNISTFGDVVHQLNLPITSDIFEGGKPSPQNSWYIAVQLPSDFTIWVGTNCANNCSDGEHGDCMCDNDYCTVATTNGTDVSPFYQLPSSLQDSSGACVCDKSKYDFSFECTQKNNGNTALYILLIAIGGLIVLGVAFGVPVYCYIANKRAKQSADPEGIATFE